MSLLMGFFQGFMFAPPQGKFETASLCAATGVSIGRRKISAGFAPVAVTV